MKITQSEIALSQNDKCSTLKMIQVVVETEEIEGDMDKEEGDEVQILLIWLDMLSQTMESESLAEHSEESGTSTMPIINKSAQLSLDIVARMATWKKNVGRKKVIRVVRAMNTHQLYQ